MRIRRERYEEISVNGDTPDNQGLLALFLPRPPIDIGLLACLSPSFLHQVRILFGVCGYEDYGQCGSPLWWGELPLLLIELNIQRIVVNVDGVARSRSTAADCKRVDSFDKDPVGREDGPLEGNVQIAVACIDG
jgi:hypothetical protein